MYETVNSVRTWHEVRGEGEPLVLLHGGFSDSRDFEPNLARLADRFRVHLVDRRGHGRTPDVPGPVSMDILTNDVISFLEQVVGGSAHLAAYSAGGVVALGVAQRRPDLVRRLVVLNTAYAKDGWMFLPAPGGELPAEIADRYAEVSPDGRDHLPVVVDKFAQAAHDPEVVDLGAITSPTLVLGSDDDIVHLEHTVALYQGIPNAQLCVLPGTSHLMLFERPDLCTTLVADFLTTTPKPLMPIRRAEVVA
ncbi:pimeloyl-ACP methyl ester carboxylesterase [Saccharothrix ecbatanensis]|uniref:Pimeloyl-ACP methyl ester carboxylesterase n=1 Tax=Saccharothrix ecbatanensis TaxID=1105145 RepID=A0A7W9HM73_9PSEU|nr:alpha/beta hydrolase [Saccharothrix ecbatanensis]MBB5804873.1 pimeloyl-ACP methyl ester carboxylesterase [Saccharothrix ecbatanensis]